MAEDQTVTQDTENTPVTYTVLETGTGGTLVSAVLTQDSPLEGTVTFDPDGSITYTPLPGEEGEALIDYTVVSEDGTESSARLTIELAPDSEPTVTASDASGVEADGVLTATGTILTDFGADDDGGAVALSATDATWDTSTATLTADDGTWAVTMGGDGYEFIQYAPLAEAADTSAGTPLNVDVTVTASDADGDMATDTFRVTLTDDGPIVQDAATSQSVEDTPVVYNVFTQDGADAGLFGGSLVAAELTEDSPYQGRVSFGADGTITYQPTGGETGDVAIDYIVEDADGDTAMARLTITLAPDSQPVITTSNVSGDETDGLVTASGSLSVDFGADGTGAVVALAAAGATWDAETATLSANDGSWNIQTDSAGYTFTQYDALDHTDMTDPDDAYVVGVTVTATDQDGTVRTGSFSVTVDDDGPTAADAAFVQDTTPDSAVSYNVFEGGDALTGMDGGALAGAALAEDSPFDGTVTYQANGTITYTPLEGETGTVTIDYMVTDGDGDTASAQLAIELATAPDYGDEYLPGQGGEVITGGDGDDSIDGGHGRDVIFGTGGNDVLIGGNSKDAILGGDGDDYLDGGKGNDLLIGGAGDDVLSGGKGSDTFTFTSPYDGMDTLLDFQSAVDKIALYESGFELHGEDGTLDPDQFMVIDSNVYEGGIDFADADSGLVYASTDDCCAGTLYFDPNDTINGDEIALATITESDGSELVADDIEII